MNQSFKKYFNLFALAVSILLFSCSPKSENNQAKTSGTPVKINNPQKMDLTEYITLNATTVFLKKEIVRATFQGFIEKIYKNIGDQILIGDVLMEIKTKESSADNNLQVPIGDNVFKGLVQIKTNSNGVLTELNYNTGDFVSDGEQIAVISNPSSLRINLNVPYQYTNKINVNKSCEIFLPNGKVVNAVVQKIIPTVDPASQTQTYILALIHSENLPENLNVNVKIPLRTFKDALVVPQSAVMTNETLDQFWIMKLTDDTTAIRIDVTKGIENDEYVQIIKPPLELTDKIIFDGSYGLLDTAKVVIGK